MDDRTHRPPRSGIDSFMSRLVDMEVDEVGYAESFTPQEAEPSAEQEGEGAEATAAAPEAGAAVEETGAVAWAPDPQEWQQAMGILQQLAPLLQQQEPQEELPPLDPYDDQFGQTLEQRLAQIEEGINSRLDMMLAPVREQQANAWVEEQVGSLPADQYTQESLTLLKDAARGIAGNTDAFNAMVAHVAKIEKAAEARGYQKKIQHAGAVGGAPREPGAGGAGSEIVTTRDGEDEVAFAQRILRGV